MSDSIAGAAAWLGGIEIVNDSRTTAYMKNGIKPSTLNVYGDCGCGNILELAGCDNEYTTPAEDDAPWYDPAIPESAEFAGFLSTEFEGLSSTYTRSVTESIADGATLGRSRFGSRTMTWKGFLFGSSCCGVAYGLRWLGKTLQGSKACGNNCFGEDLEILVCCPSMEAALGYGPNLLCNSEFKNDTSFYQSTGSTNLTWTNSVGYTELGAMQVLNSAGGEMNFNTGGNNTSNCPLPVVAEKSYRLSLYIMAAEGSNSEVLGVTFNWYDNINAPLTPTMVPSVGSDTSDWTLLETTVIAPVGATSVGIDFILGDGSSLANQAHFLDDIKLNQTDFANKVNPFRTIKGVSLLEGPLVTDERKMGSTCGGRCGGSTAIEVEFSLIGSQPWLYSDPIPVVNCVKIQEGAIPIIGATLTGRISSPSLTDVSTTINSADFAFLPVVSFPGNVYIILDPHSQFGTPEVVRVDSHTAGSTAITVTRAQQGSTARAHPFNADPQFSTFWAVQTDCSPVDCDFGLQEIIQDAFPSCGGPTLPPTAEYAGCVTPDVNDWKAIYITAPRTMWDSISEVVPVITIQTGGLPVIGARLGFYTSADGNPCGDLFNTPPTCDLICDQLFILSIPGNSKFYIDGRTRKMSLVCGTNAVFPGERYTQGPFSWPSFDCYGFCMEFAYNQLTGSDEMCISLSLVPRTAL